MACNYRVLIRMCLIVHEICPLKWSCKWCHTGKLYERFLLLEYASCGLGKDAQIPINFPIAAFYKKKSHHNKLTLRNSPSYHRIWRVLLNVQIKTPQGIFPTNFIWYKLGFLWHATACIRSSIICISYLCLSLNKAMHISIEINSDNSTFRYNCPHTVQCVYSSA